MKLWLDDFIVKMPPISEKKVRVKIKEVKKGTPKIVVPDFLEEWIESEVGR